MIAALPLGARGDALAEWLFWDDMGAMAGDAVQGYADYAAERNRWKEEASRAQRAFDQCGGCESARLEVEKWKKVESDFQDIAGNAALMSRMPPAQARLLGIDIPLVPLRSPEEREAECKIVRGDWVDGLTPECQARVDAHLDCLRRFEKGSVRVCYAVIDFATFLIERGRRGGWIGRASWPGCPTRMI